MPHCKLSDELPQRVIQLSRLEFVLVIAAGAPSNYFRGLLLPFCSRYRLNIAKACEIICMPNQTNAIACCANCQTELQGDFCHHCGQENRNYIRHAGGVVSEFFGEFSNWDSRVWRTLLPLWFRPAHLSRRYVAGHRMPYVPPLRLYLFTSVVAFLLFAKLLPTPTMTLQNPNAVAVMDTVKADLAAELATHPETTLLARQRGAQDGTVLPATHEMLPLNAQLQRKLAELADHPKLAINKFFSLAPQMMFILLPVFAALLKLLYIRSAHFYMEHLIVALHSHSFVLQMSVWYVLLITLATHVSIPWLASLLNGAATLVLCWVPLYLLLCQKGFYQQSWRKTLVKFWLTSTLYSVLATLALIAVIMLSILWA